MKHTRLLPDDPKLTAYALNELSGDERAAIEAALREQPALRVVVEEIRTAALQLEAAFAAETGSATVPLPTERNAAPPRGAAPVNGHTVFVPRARERTPPADDYAPRHRGKLIRFPQFYYVVGGCAAACFAVMVALYRDAYDAKQQMQIAQQRQRAAELAAEQARSLPLAPGTPVVALTAPAATPAAATDDAAAPVAPRAGDTATVIADQAPPTTSRGGSTRPVFVDTGLALQPSRSDTGAATATGSSYTFVLPAGGAALAEQQPGPAASEASHPAVFTGEPVAGTTGATAQPSLVETSTLPPPATVGNVALQPFSVSSPGGAAAPAFAHNTEAYAYTQDNDFLGAADNPHSTFSVDVDTASYANVRRIIEYGKLPPRDAVRVEELLNYFPYSYPPPPRAQGDSAPFAASLEVAEAPWSPDHRLVRIGLKAREVGLAERGPANLVFLLDVSGSMNAPNKLPLVKESMRLLVGRLRADDRVAIVTYAGHSGLALQSTPVSRADEIVAALDALAAGGSTNGGMGIHLAYEIAKANLVADGVNRVILCTDGDFNVGTTSEGELVRLIEEKARSGVFLTVLGFGMGNLKDATLEKLADKGNGHYGYIDTRREAEKLLVDQVSSTLVTVAKDVKIQVEFNPAKVARYRLIGYENRVLKKEDFNNDNVDAGEIGAGHSVTALYEIVPVGAADKFAAKAPPVDDLKYQARGAVSSRLEMPMEPKKAPPPSDELLTVKVRYKKPDAIFASQKMEFALKDDGRRFDKASPDFRFAAAVAQFGMILRGSPHKGSATIGDVIAWAATAAASPADDPGGYRGEFIDLARKTARIVR